MLDVQTQLTIERQRDLMDRNRRVRKSADKKTVLAKCRTQQEQMDLAVKQGWTTRGLPTPTRPMPKHCELCGKEARTRVLRNDHDHLTGKFRGWLCAGCNTALGVLGDTVQSLQKAIDYLNKG